MASFRKASDMFAKFPHRLTVSTDAFVVLLKHSRSWESHGILHSAYFSDLALF